MMIPEKIYVPEEEFEPHQDGMGAISYSLIQTQIFNTEYVITPIAKRFDVDKPKEDGWYWGYVYNKWVRCQFINSYWSGEDKWGVNPIFWCEIIKPTIPE